MKKLMSGIIFILTCVCTAFNEDDLKITIHFPFQEATLNSSNFILLATIKNSLGNPIQDMQVITIIDETNVGYFYTDEYGNGFYAIPQPLQILLKFSRVILFILQVLLLFYYPENCHKHK